jgi:hypothetical protein
MLTVSDCEEDEDPCRVKFDGSCAEGDIISWAIDTTGQLGGPFNKTGQIVYQWFGEGWGRKTIRVTLTARTGGSVASVTEEFTFPSGDDLKTLPFETDLQTTLTSQLVVPSVQGNVRGFVTLNDAKRDTTDNTRPFLHRFVGYAGKNTVTASTTSFVGGKAFWNFDFSGAEHFVSGSLRIEQGQLVSMDGHSLVFHLAGTSGDHIRFTFRLEP